MRNKVAADAAAPKASHIFSYNWTFGMKYGRSYS